MEQGGVGIDSPGVAVDGAKGEVGLGDVLQGTTLNRERPCSMGG